jgi:hypothetical protein
MKVKTINKGGNPHQNAEPLRIELPKALKSMRKHFDWIEKVGRKNIFLIDNDDNPFYVWIVRAPSNLKFDSVIRGIIKEYGNYPVYVFFTRDVKTYPTTAGNTYWSKIKSVYANAPRQFKGAIMGLNEFNANIAEMMMEHQKIKLDFNRYMDVTKGAGVTWAQLLKEIGGLSSKKINLLFEVAKQLKK